VHHAERVLEAFVRSARIDLVGEGELVDASQALERRGVDDHPLVAVEVDEIVQGVADLVPFLGHRNIFARAVSCRPADV
jgi:hypothetical protein